MIGCVVYISFSNAFKDKDSLESLLSSCQKKNSSVGITGYLFYHNTHFLQYLEGDLDVIQGVYEKILHDSRHVVLMHILKEDCQERRFPNWSMRFVEPKNFPDHDIAVVPASVARCLTAGWRWYVVRRDPGSALRSPPRSRPSERSG